MSERFLARWSRLKREAEAAPGAVPEATPPAESVAPSAGAPAQQVAAAPRARTAEADELPALDTLDLGSDFSAFLKKEVSESLRRAALKKLFSDPHFNRMDGLDVYIDDYSVSDPIPPDVLERLRQAQELLRSEASPEPSTDSAAPPSPTPPVIQAGNGQPSHRPPSVAAEPRTGGEAPAGEPDRAASAPVGQAPDGCDTLGRAGQNVASKPHES